MIPVSSSDDFVNHAATEDDCLRTSSRCADEGSIDGLAPGQLWAYYSDDSAYGVILKFYSLISRVSSKKARKSAGLGTRAAKNYSWWNVAVTSPVTGQITTRVQSFPRDLRSSGYRRIS